MNSAIHAEQFEAYSAQLLEILKGIGYSDSTLSAYRSALNKVEQYISNEHIEMYTPAIGRQFLESYLPSSGLSDRWCRYIKTSILRFNDFLQDRAFVTTHKNGPLRPTVYSSCLDGYIEHMKQRGLRPSTIKTRSIYASQFLVFIESQGIHELREMNAGHVGAALVAADSKEGFCEKVPPFMKYMYKADITMKDFSCVIPRYTSYDRLPSVYDQGELGRLLTGIDRSTPIGKRNYAIIMCAITYGMRVGDIVSLKFTDIDTENPKISFIQAKTGVPYNADLHPAVIGAITDYAEQGRPASDSPYIFLRSCAPYDRLSCGAVWSIVSTRLSACGIANDGRRQGPHTLRSSLASYLVNADVPYDIVRKILGHEDPNSTKHYVSIDIERLRKCALECPEPSEQFASYLKGGDWK